VLPRVQNGGFDELTAADEVAEDTAAITLAIATVAVVTPLTPMVLPSSATYSPTTVWTTTMIMIVHC
jgi:hypothetical protein